MVISLFFVRLVPAAWELVIISLCDVDKGDSLSCRVEEDGADSGSFCVFGAGGSTADDGGGSGYRIGLRDVKVSLLLAKLSS